MQTPIDLRTSLYASIEENPEAFGATIEPDGSVVVDDCIVEHHLAEKRAEVSGSSRRTR